MEQLLFALLAVTAIGGSVALIANRNPVHSAMFMVVVFVATAIMFLLLSAPLMAALQIIVYAGAVVVLFLFVISFLSLRSEGLFESRRGALVIGIGLTLLLAIELVAAVATLGGFRAALFGEGMAAAGAAGGAAAGAAAAAAGGAAAGGTPVFGSVESVAQLLFRDYTIPFEITSVLLLVAMVGAVVLAQRAVGGAERGATVAHEIAYGGGGQTGGDGGGDGGGGGRGPSPVGDAVATGSAASPRGRA